MKIKKENIPLIRIMWFALLVLGLVWYIEYNKYEERKIQWYIWQELFCDKWFWYTPWSIYSSYIKVIWYWDWTFIVKEKWKEIREVELETIELCIKAKDVQYATWYKQEVLDYYWK